ncbi:MAG: cytochrome c [Actinomycetota bacterium]
MSLKRPLFACIAFAIAASAFAQAKPEAVDPANAAKLAEIADNFKKDANELVKAAATGDKEATKAQFGNLTKNCKSCHDSFRKS